MRILICLAIVGFLSPSVAATEQLPRRAILHLDAFEKSTNRDELLNVVGTDVFTDYLTAVSNAWKAGPGKGKEVRWPVGLGAKGNEGGRPARLRSNDQGRSPRHQA